MGSIKASIGDILMTKKYLVLLHEQNKKMEFSKKL